MKQTIAISDIIIDKDIQPRVKGICEDHVNDLIAAYEQADADIPPPKVFNVTGKGFILVSGFHRYEALNRLGKKKIECEVRFGTYAEAELDAAASNQDHGLKRTNADKRNAVKKFLKHHPDWTDRKIADSAGVGADMVADYRQLSESDNRNEPKVGKDGKKYKPKKPKKKKSVPEDPPEDELVDVPDTVPAPSVGKLETYYKNDGVPDLPGVYRPRMTKTSDGNEVVLDGYGNPAPSAVGDTFADPKLRDILAQAITAAETLNSVYEEFLELKAGRKPYHEFPWLDIPTIQKFSEAVRENARKLCDELRAGVPYAVCPDCAGQRKGCKSCKLSGYWPKPECDVYPQRFRKAS